MELLYIWIEDYKNIHHQGFNFSPEYQFEFKPNVQEGKVTGGELSHKKKTDSLVSDFFRPDSEIVKEWKDKRPGLGRISNVTAVIGKNGSGKSNLLEFLKENLLSENYNSPPKFFAVTKDPISAEQAVLFNPFRWNILAENSEIVSKDQMFEEMKNLQTVLYSIQFHSRFEPSDFKQPGFSTANYYPRVVDISTESLILGEFNSSAMEFSIKENNKAVFFFQSLQKNIPLRNSIMQYIKFPEKTVIRFNKSELRLSEKEKFPQAEKFFDDSSKKYFRLQLVSQSKEKDYKYILYVQILRFFYIKYRAIISTLFEDKFEEILNLYDSDEETTNWEIIINSIEAYFDALLDIAYKKSEEKEADQYGLKCLNSGNLKAVYEAFVPLLNRYRLENKPAGNSQAYFFTLEVDTENPAFWEFITAYKKISNSVPFLFFSLYPELSSGEKAFLFLSSRFSATIDPTIFTGAKICLDAPNILLLIDEGEIGFHPEWQRRYLKYLIDFFPQIYPGKNIQIILTSHSPFLVSDLPKENIIFLQKGETEDENFQDGTPKDGKCIVVNAMHKKHNTFGGNIHTLFADSFFMENSTLMGEFAKGKIEEILNFYNAAVNRDEKESIEKYKTEYGNRRDYFYSVCYVIGEEYLKNIVKNHLEELDRILLKVDPTEDEIQEFIKRFGKEKIRRLVDKNA